MTEEEIEQTDDEIKQEGGDGDQEDEFESVIPVVEQEPVEDFEPPEEMSEEEKQLVEKMTQVLDDVLTED